MRFKKFDEKYTGGGLIDDPAIKKCLPLGDSSDANFTVPEWIDSRALCVPASNQGNLNACAGFATAGYKEVTNWQDTNIAVQFDGVECYNGAKAVDGSPNSAGTTLSAAVQSGINLGWFPKKTKIRIVQSQRDVQFALHKFGVCIIGCNITVGWRSVDLDEGWISDSDNSKIGGHAILACYYDSLGLGIQNSWDLTWGVKGFGRMTWAQFNDQFMYGVVLE